MTDLRINNIKYKKLKVLFLPYTKNPKVLEKVSKDKQKN